MAGGCDGFLGFGLLCVLLVENPMNHQSINGFHVSKGGKRRADISGEPMGYLIPSAPNPQSCLANPSRLAYHITDPMNPT